MKRFIIISLIFIILAIFLTVVVWWLVQQSLQSKTATGQPPIDSNYHLA